MQGLLEVNPADLLHQTKQEGLLEGEQLKAYRMARKSVGEISEFTELPLAQIQKLSEELKA